MVKKNANKKLHHILATDIKAKLYQIKSGLKIELKHYLYFWSASIVFIILMLTVLFLCSLLLLKSEEVPKPLKSLGIENGLFVKTAEYKAEAGEGRIDIEGLEKCPLAIIISGLLAFLYKGIKLETNTASESIERNNITAYLKNPTERTKLAEAYKIIQRKPSSIKSKALKRIDSSAPPT